MLSFLWGLCFLQLASLLDCLEGLCLRVSISFPSRGAYSLGGRWLRLLAAVQWGHLCLINPGGEEGVGVVKRLKAFQSSERDPEIRRREGTAPTPPPKLTLGLEGKRLTVRYFYSGTTLQAAMGPSTPLLILFLLSWSGPLQGQQHHLVEYMERRLAALEVRDPFLF